MRDVFATTAAWLDEQRSFALATLVALHEAATAPLGTTIAVDASGQVFGNIGAGCYEAEIVDACLKTAADGQTRRLDINLTSEDELLGGTACGAVMQLVAWRPELGFRDVAGAIAAGERDASLRLEYDSAGGGRVTFEHVFRPKERLFLIGTTTLAGELATIARRLDFNVIVVDPRPAFATKERIPDASEIVRAWPDEYLPHALTAWTPVVVLSHDPKFDLPALRCALNSLAPYIGLLGSRRSQAARRASLREEGFSDAALARIHGPAGLDIGGVTVAETALSILAEIVAARRGGDGAPLRSARGAIHRQLERAVVLAAGTSSRAGGQKLLMDFRGRPMIEHSIAAARRWNPVVVAGAEVYEYLSGRDGIALLRNDEPERGMSHSLAMANEFLRRGVPMIVLLGDKPRVTPQLIEAICEAAGGADVVYPVRGDEPGHPVWLSPDARERIAELPPGDTLRSLRDDSSLTSRAVEVQDAGAFFDVDTIANLSS